MDVAVVASNGARIHTCCPRPKREIGIGVKRNQFHARPAQDTPIGRFLAARAIATPICLVTDSTGDRWGVGSRLRCIRFHLPPRCTLRTLQHAPWRQLRMARLRNGIEHPQYQLGNLLIMLTIQALCDRSDLQWTGSYHALSVTTTR